MIFSTSVAILIDVYPVGRRGRAMGIIFSYYMGDHKVTDENIHIFIKCIQITLYLSSALSLLGTLFSMVKGALVNRYCDNAILISPLPINI